jgi:hypothetical protein
MFPFIFLLYIRMKAAAEGIELLKQHVTFIPIKSCWL